MVSWFIATEKVLNKQNSFTQMIKIAGNCDINTANIFYGKYRNSSYIQRLALGRDIRKRHHEIVYGDHKPGGFYQGINSTAPYPYFPVTKFINDNLPFINLPDLKKKVYDEDTEEQEFYEEDIEFFEEITDEYFDFNEFDN